MIRKTHQQIETLPKPPPQNALNEVAKLIKDFDADIGRHIEGVPYKEGIIQRIRVPCKRFRQAIRATAPEFRPFDQPNFSAKSVYCPPRVKTLVEPEFLKHEEEGYTREYDWTPASSESEDHGTEASPLIYVDEVSKRMEE